MGLFGLGNKDPTKKIQIGDPVEEMYKKLRLTADAAYDSTRFPCGSQTKNKPYPK